MLRAFKFNSCSAQKATLGSLFTTAPACTQHALPSAEDAQVARPSLQHAPSHSQACAVGRTPLTPPSVTTCHWASSRLLILLCLIVPQRNSCFIICLQPLALEGLHIIEPKATLCSLPSSFHIRHQGAPPLPPQIQPKTSLTDFCQPLHLPNLTLHSSLGQDSFIYKPCTFPTCFFNG